MYIFCDIVSRQSPADIIWENDDVVCFFRESRRRTDIV